MRIVGSDDAFEAALTELEPYLREDGYDVKDLTPHNAVGLVVQEYIRDAEGSPGAAVIVGGGAFPQHIFVGVTEQVLDAEGHHMGNTYPLGSYYTPEVHREILAMMERAAEEVRKRNGGGMMLCADFVVAELEGKYIPYLVEFNMRLSAQYGGLAMVHTLFGSTAPIDRQYFVGNLPFHQDGTSGDVGRVFDRLEHDRQLFSTTLRTGIVPLNLTIPEVLQGLIVAENRAALSDMLTRGHNV